MIKFDPMKLLKTILFLFIISILLSSCSIEKRHYLSGFYIQTNGKKIINFVYKTTDYDNKLGVQQNKFIPEVVNQCQSINDESSSLVASSAKDLNPIDLCAQSSSGFSRCHNKEILNSNLLTKKPAKPRRLFGAGKDDGTILLLILIIPLILIVLVVRQFFKSTREGCTAACLLLGVMGLIFWGLGSVLVGYSFFFFAALFFLASLFL